MTEGIFERIENEIETLNNFKNQTAKTIYEILKSECKTFGDLDREYQKLCLEVSFSYCTKNKSDEVLKTVKEIIEKEKSNSLIMNHSLEN